MFRLMISTGITKVIEKAAQNHSGSVQAIYYAATMALEAICEALDIDNTPQIQLTQDAESIDIWIGEEGRTIDDQIDIWLTTMRERAICEQRTHLNNLFDPGNCQQLRTSGYSQ